MSDLLSLVRTSLHKATWDETKHPRHSDGSPNGGQFKAKGAADVVAAPAVDSDPEPTPPPGVKPPEDEWEWPKSAGEKKFWPVWRAWKERQNRKRPPKAAPQTYEAPPPKLGPGMLMPGVPKSWQKLGGKKEIEVGRSPLRGWNDPRFMRITRWDDTTIKVIEKMPRYEHQVEVEAELENELVAGRIAELVGAVVPHTEASGIVLRQEFVEGKTLDEEISDRLKAMTEDEFKGWYRQRFKDVPPPAYHSLKDQHMQDFIMKYVDANAFPDLARRLEGVQNGVVDFLMDQQDRSQANLFFGEDGGLILIDNGNTGFPGRTKNYSNQSLPEKSVLIEVNAGKPLGEKQKAGLEKIKADESFPEAIRFRADFLLRYGYIPFKELAANKLWADMYSEYQQRKKK